MYASFIHQCIHGIHSANKLETKHELIFLFIVFIHTYLSCCGTIFLCCLVISIQNTLLMGKYYIEAPNQINNNSKKTPNNNNTLANKYTQGTLFILCKKKEKHLI